MTKKIIKNNRKKKRFKHLRLSCLQNWFEIRGWRDWMTAENCTFGKMLEDMICYRNICQQHKFFDHAIGIKHWLRNYIDGIIGFTAHFKSDFWTC